jgi:hypothetical protein
MKINKKNERKYYKRVAYDVAYITSLDVLFITDTNLEVGNFVLSLIIKCKIVVEDTHDLQVLR